MTIELVRGGRDVGTLLVEPLARWVEAVPFEPHLHPGDVGWHLRHPDEQLAEGAFLLWSRDGRPVAAGLAEATMLRTAVDPSADRDGDLADAIRTVAADYEYVDALAGSAVRRLMLADGWRADPDPWVLLHKKLDGNDADLIDPDTRAVDGTADFVAARVEVQRSAFAPGSTFTTDRWERMASSPAYDRRFDLVTWAPDGTPAAAATGWFAGPGRCAILEPVGTHADHRRQGYGRRVTVAVMAALAAAGASGVRVHTPMDNGAAVSAYERSGLRRVEVTTALMPPGAG